MLKVLICTLDGELLDQVFVEVTDPTSATVVVEALERKFSTYGSMEEYEEIRQELKADAAKRNA